MVALVVGVGGRDIKGADDIDDDDKDDDRVSSTATLMSAKTFLREEEDEGWRWKEA